MKLPAVQPDVFLHPGEFFFGSAPRRIGTLLGSCVSVTLWCPRHHIGGMCHILLPSRRRPPGSPLDGRYADEILELFANELHARNISPNTCQAKLFGGGNMFAGNRAGTLGIGHRNIEAARRALAEHGLPVVAEHVGGTRHRRLSLDLATGHVWLAAPGNQPSHGKLPV